VYSERLVVVMRNLINRSPPVLQLVRDTLDARGCRAQGTQITNRMNGKLNVDKGTNMKSPLIVASAAVLFVMAGVAHSQGTPQAVQPAPQENAATPKPLTRVRGWKHTAVRPTHGYKAVQDMPDRAGWIHNATFFSEGANGVANATR
jgi:hypothetical protein